MYELRLKVRLGAPVGGCIRGLGGTSKECTITLIQGPYSGYVEIHAAYLVVV